MRYRISHRTEYKYEAPVTMCYNEARMEPRGIEGQRVFSHDVAVSPLPAVRSVRSDFFGNPALHFAVQTEHRQLQVISTSEVETIARTLPEPGASSSWEEAAQYARRATADAAVEVRPYILDSPMVSPFPALESFVRESFVPGRAVFEATVELTSRIHEDFSFDPAFSTVATPLEKVFEHKRGVCQDFAHLGISCLRLLGLPARYVSGYLETIPPEGAERLVGADASHAWFAVYVPELGWVDFDPTNDQIPGEQHITTAWGRDYSDVTPLKGVIFGGGSSHTTRVAVDVERI